MSTTTFTANNNPNPGLEDVLDPNGSLSLSATTFQITNTAGGAFNGFVFRFTSTAADFTFNGNQPTGGTIDSATVFDAEFDVVAQITNIPNSQLVIVWGSTKNFGAFTGLASLFGDFLPDSFVGSTVADRLTSFTIGDTLSGGGGADVLTSRSSNSVLIGGTGDDVFRSDGFSAPAALHGSAQNGTGGAGETDTIEVVNQFASFASATITNIDVVRFSNPVGAPIDMSVSFSTGQFGGGLPSTLKIIGAAADTENQVNISRGGNVAVNLNLSGLQFTAFSGANRTISVDLRTSLNFQDTVIGSSQRDSISTGAGSDTLRGGAGIDFLFGGTGDDLFLYGANESGSGESINGENGTDTVHILGNNNFVDTNFASIERVVFAGAFTLTFSSTLPAMTFVGNANANKINFVLANSSDLSLEYLTFQSWGTTDTVTVNASSRADTITGSVVNDLLNGGAGRDVIAGDVGNDRVNGGDGGDTLSGDIGNDAVGGAAGNDTIEGGAGNDTLDGGGDADIIDGGAGNDVINGGTGNDAINGGAGNDTINGGTSADRMDGGIGNDSYRVDHVLDQVFEDAGGGIDTVIASVSYVLTEGSDVNVLRTTAPTSTTPINLTGNAFGQTIQGNAASNVIAGGLGNDKLTGNAGKDFFLFDTAPSATTNKDSITDFVAVNDTIRIDDDVFIGLATGALSAAAFRLGAAAADATDRIIYNKATGAVIFDSNGNAAGGAVQFATLTTKPTITNVDFVVI